MKLILIRKTNEKTTTYFTLLLLLSLLWGISGCKKGEFSPKEDVVATDNIENAVVTGKPNIILIVGDDVGYEIPTVNGGQSYSTPNLDFIAKNGMRFTRCYGAPNCSPSRFMMLTGKYNFRNYTKWGVMDRSQRTIGNMLKNVGYATCYVGKWQLDGGDTSVHTFGFDKYSVWEPYEIDPEEDAGPRYKSPVIFQDGKFLQNTLNKYSVDIYTKYALNFIDSNKQKPFFIYYSMPLMHKPFMPVPGDPQYLSWSLRNSATKFFPQMVAYMDSQIRTIQTKLQTSGLKENTIIIFVGDNGTAKNIFSQFNGITIPGSKGETTTWGTRVPLYVYWPGTIKPGVSNQLVDFTDFMPTLAGLANIPVPTTFGTLDGKTFKPILTGSSSTARKYVFCHFLPGISDRENPKLIRWVQDTVYKLYETGQFFNMKKDIQELSPIPADQLTTLEVQKKSFFQSVLSTMHK